MSRAVFDASVLVKLVIEERATPQARESFVGCAEPLAPDWCMVECVSALWRKALRGEYPAGVMHDALGVLRRLDLTLLGSADLVGATMDIALAQKHPVYDCLYVALALAEGAALVTADAAQREIALAAGVEVVWIESDR